ncbi:hypothetical protein [Escherichia coli]|nr:hypothetical protein [Escherichia coli]MCI4855997.1 hypothetical protein [Escherichia coli]MDD8597669.1 hypothetical protein [Escherichia coli]
MRNYRSRYGAISND